MPLLSSRSAAGLWGLLALVACDEDPGQGQISLQLYDQPVRCDAARGLCVSPDANQEPLPSEPLSAPAYFGSGASQYGDGGLYIFFELTRASGAVAVVEIDVPAGTGVGGGAKQPHLLYQEYLEQRLVFRSTRAVGRVEVPMERGCDCQDGRLELLFTDAGPDGQLDTDDDQLRRLSRGLFGLPSNTCRLARLLDIESHTDVEVAGLYGCPGTATAYTSSGGGGAAYVASEVGCEADPDDYYYDDGCEGSGGGGYSGSSCEGDSSDWSSSEGCEGDSSGGSTWSDSGGCEGDSSSPDIDCEGDAQAASGSAAPAGRRRLRGPPLSLMLALALVFIDRTRRRRRRRRRRPAPGL